MIGLSGDSEDAIEAKIENVFLPYHQELKTLAKFWKIKGDEDKNILNK